ncbi:MAG: efflux RND transporter periplasmic adaptor subunit [Vicinamibacteria bacterium]|jgi:HlyD family secretion protein|nr:efflux RND transporter periplasmic adaptor subunit [Vicinamibacteria bacterium]
MRKGIITVTAVGLVGGVSLGLYSWGVSSKDLPYKTVAVTRGDIVEKALAIGAIKPEREIAVKSKISGIVKRRFREVGDRVRAGDPLFEILPDPTPLERTEARRELEIAKNVFDQAQKTYERYRTLRTQGIVAGQDWEKAEKDVQDARIRLNLAGERLALIEKGRIQTDTIAVESIIRAPISGTVLELLVNEGDPVVPLTSYQAGTPLANLADMSTLIFKGTVDEIDVGKLHEGMPAWIKVGALPETKVTGRVAKIAPKSKTAEGATLFEIEIAIQPAKSIVLRAGYSANADVVITEKKGVLLLPERLVTFAGGKTTVEVPGVGQAEPKKQAIKIGLSDGINVEVAEGLREQDLVVERPPKKIE